VRIAAAALLLLLLSGCGSPATPPTVSATVKQVNSTQPPYSATLHLPQLAWPGHTAVADKVNAAVDAWAADEVAVFGESVAQDLANAKNMPASLPQSSLTVTYQGAETTPRVVSFHFLVEPYVRGAAHPSQTPAGLTFNLKDGSAYTLDGLFKPGYSATLVQAAGKGLASWTPAGAHCYLGKAPTNLGTWWLSPSGLVLAYPAGVYTASYCGPPTVTVPAAQLKRMALPGSPLA